MYVSRADYRTVRRLWFGVVFGQAENIYGEGVNEEG
jgi:hypothetical protein